MTRLWPHKAATHLPWLLAAVLCCVPAWAQAGEAQDDTAREVLAAERVFRLSLTQARLELSKEVERIMEREIQAAVDQGDLDRLEDLQAQLKAFQEDQVMPDVPATRSHAAKYRKQRTRLGDDLIRSYDAAKKAYTRARDVPNARLMQDKIDWLRPTNGLDVVERRGRLYLLVREKKTWTQARAACQALGGDLACINSRAEHRFIYEEITQGQNVITWVGATDAHKEGDWVWLDGSDDYWPWNKGEPNNTGRAPQNHAALNKGGTISDLAEHDSRINAYLCEWDGPPTRETVYTAQEDPAE